MATSRCFVASSAQTESDGKEDRWAEWLQRGLLGPAGLVDVTPSWIRGGLHKKTREKWEELGIGNQSTPRIEEVRDQEATTEKGLIKSRGGMP